MLLFRHGPAEDRDPIRWPKDEERPLSKDGRKATRGAARGLRRVKVDATQIISSPARRALATAEILARELRIDRRIEIWPELAPDGDPVPVTHRLERMARHPGMAIVVGHEPLLGEMIGLALTGEAISVTRLAKAGGALLEFPGGVVPGGGTVDWLLTRAQLVRLGANDGGGR